MKDGMKKVLITGGLSLASAILGAVLSQTKISQELKVYFGDESISVVSEDYKKLKEENENLQKSLNNLSSEKKELETRLSNIENEYDQYKTSIEESEKTEIYIPELEYKDSGLFIDGVEIIYDKKKSVLNIDGQHYFSENMLKGIVKDNIYYDADNILIGKQYAPDERISLFDMDFFTGNFKITNNAEDTLGNSYGRSFIISQNKVAEFFLDGNYSRLTGRLAYLKGNDDYPANIYFRTDGIVKEKFELNIRKEPIDFELDLTDARFLNIATQETAFSQDMAIILTDVYLYK